MPVIYRNMFMEAFSKLDQRILWKFEADLKDISKNVMISKWLPQQDILGEYPLINFLKLEKYHDLNGESGELDETD